MKLFGLDLYKKIKISRVAIGLLFLFCNATGDYLQAADFFDQKIEELAFESKDALDRIEKYKQLVSYAGKLAVSDAQINKIFDALQATYKVRDVSSRLILTGLQDVLLRMNRVEGFVGFQEKIAACLNTLEYDLRPFSVKSGDYITLNLSGKNVPCVTAFDAGGFVLKGAVGMPGKQVRLDSLFKIYSESSDDVIKSGDVVRLQPVYVRYGSYVLPPFDSYFSTANNALDRHGTGHSYTFNPGSKLVVFLPDGAERVGSVIVQEQAVSIAPLASNLVWTCLGQDDFRISMQSPAMQRDDNHLFTIRTVRESLVKKAHQKLVGANLALALKAPSFEEKIAGFNHILSAIRSGVGVDERDDFKIIFKNIFSKKSLASNNELRLMHKLFDQAAAHPDFAVHKLSLEQSAGEIRDALLGRAVSFGSFVALADLSHQRAVQATLADGLTKLGHLKISTGMFYGSRLMGQQCVMFDSLSGKTGPISFGDEVTIKSFFVDDGRDGGLLACPVTWWVNNAKQDDTSRAEVLASNARAIQTRNGQEVFVLTGAQGKVNQGPLLPGDALCLVSKKTGAIVRLGSHDGRYEGDFVFEVAAVEREKLANLANKRFKGYMYRFEKELDPSKKLLVLEAAVDVFKGQPLLSSQAGKSLYAALKRVACEVPCPNELQNQVQTILAKAGRAPFSQGAKNRFMLWCEKLQKGHTVPFLQKSVTA